MVIFKRFANGTSDGGFEKACKYLLKKLGYKNCGITKTTGDDGVDIVAEKDGVSFGFQCKNYDNKVSNDKIRDFNSALTIYGASKGIFMTTNTFTSFAIKTAKILGIELWDYTKIKEESNKLGFDLETLEPVKERKIKSIVFDHNKVVYEKAEQMLNDYNKVIITMGTGIGKTTTALEYCIRHNCRALVICPNNVVRDSWENNKANKNNRLADTDTYQSFSKDYMDRDYSIYGVVIFDEVHHGGAETWGAGIKYLMDNNIKVIGLTATEERTDGINVAEALFENHSADGLDILGGIREGVVYPFTYVGAIYDAENVCRIEKEKYGDKLTELLLGKLDTALNNTKDVRDIIKKDMPKGKRKGIIFSADIESMDGDIKLIHDVYPKAVIKKLHSNMTAKEQKEVKDWFNSTRSGYICTVNMANEGAHYDNVNTIFMLRKTDSELIFLQQLGRAITSTYGNKNPNTVIFDLVNSSKAILNVKRKFKDSGIEDEIDEITEDDFDTVKDFIKNNYCDCSYSSHTGEKDCEELPDDVELTEKDIYDIEEETGVDLSDLYNKYCNKKAKDLNKTVTIKDLINFKEDYGKSKQIIVKDYSKPIEEVLEELHNKFDAKPWTDEDIAKIKKMHSEGKSIIDILNYFPNRTYASLKNMCSKVGIRFKFFYSDEVIDYLTMHYSEFGPDKCADILKIKKSAIKCLAYRLGLKYNKYFWSNEDEEYLIKNFPIYGSECFKHISSHTKKACINKCKKLGLRCNNAWTDSDNEIVSKFFPTGGVKECLKYLPNHTAKAIETQAHRLGIKKIKHDRNMTPSNSRKVICIETNDVIDTIMEASRKYGINEPTIYRACKSESHFGNKYHWIYYDEYCLNKEQFNQLKNKKNTNGILCIETNIIYNSLKEASKQLDTPSSNIWSCLKGKRKTAGGYHWKYVEEQEERTDSIIG